MMNLSSLIVIHESKENHPAFSGAPLFSPFRIQDFFKIETCLRNIWIGLDRSPAFRPELPAHFQYFRGADAYQFLLKLACGLRSKILGETDIFGQIKECWQKFEKENLSPGSVSALAVRHLKPWMQRLFEDTKDIRTRYIQGAGGFSYGSLVRHLFKPSPEDKVLLIGAGKLALSVAPYLSDSEVLLWNRTQSHLMPIVDELHRAKAAHVTVIESSDTATKEEAWKTATYVILCVPLDRESDKKLLDLWATRPKGEKPGAILHLGVLRRDAGEWNEADHFYCLDDLFDLQKIQDKLRNEHFRQARKACVEKTNLRLLGGPMTMPHGWEDLALFG